MLNADQMVALLQARVDGGEGAGERLVALAKVAPRGRTLIARTSPTSWRTLVSGSIRTPRRLC